MTFEPLPDHELQKLGDEQLIAYIRDSRTEGELAAGRRGLAILVYGYERDVKRRLSLRGAQPTSIDDVAHDALVRAIAAAFDGTSVGEFRSWLHTIVDRTAVDFYRRAERRPKESVLPSEHAGEEDVWGDEPFVDSEAGAVELRIIIEEVLETFNEKHRQVIELHVFGGATRERGMRQDRGNERGQRRPDRLEVPREAPRPPRSRYRRRPMSDVDRLLAEYIAEHRAGGEADPRAFLSRASPAEQRELASLIDAYLARAPRQSVRPGELSRLERRADRRRARARARRPGGALARAAATTA